ncbi:hypothetical protein [Halorubrum pallidum]
MNARPVAAIGTALTTFLLVSAVLTTALASRIEFSALVGLPVGIAVGVAAGVAAWVWLWNAPPVRPALLGWSSVGYALLTVAAVSYAVPPARGLVSVRRAVVVAGVCGLVVFAVAVRYPDRFD